jgi:hypothetical protein
MHLCAPPSADTAPDARAQLLALINASWTTQALAAAARLRLCERLAEQSMSLSALATACDCHAPALQRLLRALATLDVVVEAADGCYAVGPLGTHLVSDRPGGLGPWAELCGTSSWRSWERLLDCVRSGRSARELEGGRAGLYHLDADPIAAALFHRAMAAISHTVAEAAAAALDLAPARCVLDVGGGTGELLTVVLGTHRHLRGVLLDRPHAIETARARLQETGLAERCTLIGGDFFDSIPAGCDVLLLKSILHDWDDDHCQHILQRCRQAMRADTKLAVIERLMPERSVPSVNGRAIARSDLNMLVGPGGQERTRAAYAELLARGGLRAVAVTELVDHYSMIEAVVS